MPCSDLYVDLLMSIFTLFWFSHAFCYWFGLFLRLQQLALPWQRLSPGPEVSPQKDICWQPLTHWCLRGHRCLQSAQQGVVFKISFLHRKSNRRVDIWTIVPRQRRACQSKQRCCRPFSTTIDLVASRAPHQRAVHRGVWRRLEDRPILILGP